MGTNNVTSSDITTLPNGRHFLEVKLPSSATPEKIIGAIGKEKPQAAIIIVGGIDDPTPERQARLSQLFSRGLASAIVQNTALVMDRGADSTTMEMLRNSLADRASSASLAVNTRQATSTSQQDNNGLRTPADQQSNTEKAREKKDEQIPKKANKPDKPDIDPLCFITVENDNNEITIETMYKVVEAMEPRIPVLVILLNGKDTPSEDIVRCIRREWQILVIEGSGGLADEFKRGREAQEEYIRKLSIWKPPIANQKQDQDQKQEQDKDQKQEQNKNKPEPPFIADMAVSEGLLKGGKLNFLSLNETPKKLELAINLCLKEHTILKRASMQQWIYSQEANYLEERFFRLQDAILVLGVFVTLLAVIQSFYKLPSPPPFSSINNIKTTDIFYGLLIGITALITLLRAGANRFDPGNKWVELRAASEAFKREMFRYRTHSGIYSDVQIFLKRTTRENALYQELETISEQWVKNNLDAALLERLNGQRKQRRFLFWGGSRTQNAPRTLSTYFPPDGYIKDRLLTQINFYNEKSAELERRQSRWQWAILIIGGIATLLAAFHGELFITLTTAIITSMTTHLEYRQTANTLKQYKQASKALENINNWWTALGVAQAEQDNIDKLVDHVEITLQTEHSGWVQQMLTALTELRDQQAKQGQSPAGAGPINLEQDGKLPTTNGVTPPEQKDQLGSDTSQGSQSTTSDETDTLQADGQQNTSGTDDSGSGDTGTKGTTRPLDTSD